MNQSYTSDIAESGIEIYTNPPSILSQQPQNRPNNFLNASTISFDLLNTNANAVKTRYDVKSLSNSSLYSGSKVIFNSKSAMHKLVLKTFTYRDQFK